MTSRLAFPTTFTEAEEILAKGRNKDSRTIANNTRLIRRRPDKIALQLHATDVVSFHRNGDVVLNSGGWLTLTTKDRINNALAWPNVITQRHGRWYFSSEGWDNPDGMLPYEDGMIIHADGTTSLTREPEVAAVEDRMNEKMRKDVARYMRKITPEAIVVAADNAAGDCLLCAAGSDECLADHVRENYFHMALLRRAIYARQYPDPNLIIWHIVESARSGRKDYAVQHVGSFLRKRLAVGNVAVA